MLGSPVPSLSWSFSWIPGHVSAGGTVHKLSVVSLTSVSLLSQDALHIGCILLMWEHCWVVEWEGLAV